MKRQKPGMPDRRYRALVHQTGADEGLEVLGFGGPDPASPLVPAWDSQTFRDRLGFHGTEASGGPPSYVVGTVPCPGVKP